jgi:hypothetical protein
MLPYIDRLFQLRDILESTRFNDSALREVSYDIDYLLNDQRC